MTVSWASQLCDELSRKFFNRGPARDSAGAPARDCARDHPRDKRTPVTRRNNSAEPRRQARPALNALAIARANLRGEGITPTHRTHSRPSHQYLRGVSAADTPARPLCTPPHAKAPRPAVAHFAQASGAATYRPPWGAGGCPVPAEQLCTVRCTSRYNGPRLRSALSMRTHTRYRHCGPCWLAHGWVLCGRPHDDTYRGCSRVVVVFR